MVDFNQDLWRSALQIWQEAGQRWLGLAGLSSDDGQSARSPDKRFAAPEWHTNPAYRTLKEVYLLASDWLLKQSDADDDLDEAERQRINFHLRQFVDAMSPTLMLMSNPTALHKAIETGGASVVAGARNLMTDLNAGRLTMVDAEAFAPGRNLALTPGNVVYRNRLIELIQYAPTTEEVHKTPLLILGPWINKYYILDMQPKNSMMRYLVEQGFTVFVVSWKNPDASMDEIGIEDYMDLGPLAASDVIREITGSPTVNVMGYCIGGTLLTMTLAALAAKGDERFNAASFMVSLQDFSRVGDTAVFMDEPAIDLIEQQMMERGYLDSREMSNMFNLLRSNDLIWANVVNNYLLGNKPPAFDLLYWNSDGTRMTRAAHGWYLRNTYVENNLIEPGKSRSRARRSILAAFARTPMRSGRRRITSCPGTPPGASHSCLAVTCGSCVPPAVISQGSSILPVAKAPTGPGDRRCADEQPRAVAAECDAPRGKLVAGLGGVAFGALGSEKCAAPDRQREISAIAGCAWHLCPGKIGWLRSIGMSIAQRDPARLTSLGIGSQSVDAGARCQMKITMDVECTPEEARAFLGLPDVKPMQEQLMREVQDRMTANIRAMEPEAMLRTWLPATLKGFEQMQEIFMSQMTGTKRE